MKSAKQYLPQRLIMNRTALALLIMCSFVGAVCAQKNGEGVHSAVCSKITKEEEQPTAYVKRSISYGCEVEECSVEVEVGLRDDDSTFIALNNSGTCAYPIQFRAWEQLILEARNDGLLSNVKDAWYDTHYREMCGGDTRKRQIITVLRLLSEKRLKKADESEVYMNLELVWSESDVFREYRKMFARLGYQLESPEYEKVGFEKVHRDEILKCDPASKLDSLYITCDAMLSFDIK